MAAAGTLGSTSDPFILTLEMDGEAFAALDALRRRYYAQERNQVPAHVTLFYRLPRERSREIKLLLVQMASAQRSIEVPAGEVRATERGVAIFLHSPQLSSLRERLASEMDPWLREEDRARFQPHVTLQTTLNEGEARRTTPGDRRDVPAAADPRHRPASLALPQRTLGERTPLPVQVRSAAVQATSM